MQILNRRPQNEQQREKRVRGKALPFVFGPTGCWDKQAINGAKEVILHFNPSPLGKHILPGLPIGQTFQRNLTPADNYGTHNPLFDTLSLRLISLATFPWEVCWRNTARKTKEKGKKKNEINKTWTPSPLIFLHLPPPPPLLLYTYQYLNWWKGHLWWIDEVCSENDTDRARLATS